ncbi:MAG: hypothetical protein K9K93_08215, partial [Acholeplasmataceae bacterium]|nr:hypothetical protein [Acholeplasmataceae bacterium]
ERESNFLHMTYKYVLALFKAGLYEVFFDEIKDNYTCFMDPLRYGRPPFENSSFLAPTANPDPKKHGQGFVSRLTGSTAEILSMWRLMFFGDRLFEMDGKALTFRLKPMLDASFFDEKHHASATLFNTTTVVYHNPSRHNLYDHGVGILSMTLIKDGIPHVIEGDLVRDHLAHDIRNGLIEQIDVMIGIRQS